MPQAEIAHVTKGYLQLHFRTITIYIPYSILHLSQFMKMYLMLTFHIDQKYIKIYKNKGVLLHNITSYTIVN